MTTHDFRRRSSKEIAGTCVPRSTRTRAIWYLTDPPYFLAGLDDACGARTRRPTGRVVMHLTARMKFEPRMGARLQCFMRRRSGSSCFVNTSRWKVFCHALQTKAAGLVASHSGGAGGCRVPDQGCVCLAVRPDGEAEGSSAGSLDPRS